MRKEKTLQMRFSVEELEDLTGLAKMMGITRTAVIRLCLTVGTKTLKMSLDPKWQSFIEEKIRKGEPIEIPEIEDK